MTQIVKLFKIILEKISAFTNGIFYCNAVSDLSGEVKRQLGGKDDKFTANNTALTPRMFRKVTVFYKNQKLNCLSLTGTDNKPVFQAGQTIPC